MLFLKMNILITFTIIDLIVLFSLFWLNLQVKVALFYQLCLPHWNYSVMMSYKYKIKLISISLLLLSLFYVPFCDGLFYCMRQQHEGMFYLRSFMIVKLLYV